MAPDAPMPPPPCPTTAEGDHQWSSASGSGPAVTRAPLSWPATHRKPPASSPPRPSSSNELSEASDSDVSSQGDDCHSRAKRVRVESPAVQQDASSPASAAPAPASSSVGHVEASEEAEPPPAALTAAMMAERASAMFSLDATGPAASGMPKVAEKATMELVSLAFGAVGKLCDQHGKALSKAFGNFDRVVGLGWLVTDALGCPRVHKVTAYTVGLKLRKLPSELKAEQLAARKVASRAISKLAADDPKRQELKQAAADEEARLLRVEMLWPSQNASCKKMRRRKANATSMCSSVWSPSTKIKRRGNGHNSGPR
jgi:hypothetical protein